MGDLFSPKVSTPEPTASEKAAQSAAERDRLDAARKQAEARTSQLMRLYGARSALGFGGGF